MSEKITQGFGHFFKSLAVGVAISSAGALLLAFLVVAVPTPAAAQVSVGFSISVNIPPPPLPVYVQPLCPGPDYIWTPGYWAWDPDYGYYWVPGTWVLAPYPGLLWTPGYWGWYNGAYVWYDGYWGPVVGFYGGINYGFGYNGYGYYGGYWDHGRFYYNRRVNNVDVRRVTTIYTRSIPRSVTTRRVSFNGGQGGVTLRPTAVQQTARQRGTAPIAAQTEHIQAARHDPRLRASDNRGRPAIAATPRPGAFTAPGVVRATRAGAPYKPQPMGRAVTQPHEGRAPMPGGHEERRPVTVPGREAPVAPGVHPAPPRGEYERPTYRPVEPRREQPAPGMIRQPQAPAPERQMPRMAPPQGRQEFVPEQGRPQFAPEQGRPRPQGGERREEDRFR
ncbi:MAG TPA: hypothetical protein VI389_01100 [Geobacteraceae bacterium]